MNSFKELNVWKESIKLAGQVYRLTSTFPNEEKFGLISQLQRASVSISTNIAEGAGRNNKGEFYHFLGIAQGSASEVESLIYVSVEVRIIKESEVSELLDLINKIQNMLFKLRQTLK
jgi:four helix bundle protein